MTLNFQSPCLHNYGYKCTPPQTIHVELGIELKALCMLGKPCTKGATSPDSSPCILFFQGWESNPCPSLHMLGKCSVSDLQP